MKNSKKTVVVAEMLYPKGHKTLDEKIIRILALSYNVIIMNYKDFLREESLPDLKFITLKKQIIIERHEPFIRFGIIYNLIQMKFLLSRIDFETIIFLSINNYVIKYLDILFSNKKIAVIHHNNIDNIMSKKSLRDFRVGMYSVEHIVFGDYIKSGLNEKTGCPLEIIHSVPHPITVDLQNIEIDAIRDKIIVGIGLSNDEEFIKVCIEIDKKLKILPSYSIVLRSKYQKYEGNILRVISGYMNEDRYNEYFCNSSAVVIYYPNNFNLRYSGTLVNALVQNGKILINAIPVAVEEAEKYPNNIQIINRPLDLFELKEDFFMKSVNLDERARYLINHSDKIISEYFNNIIG